MSYQQVRDVVDQVRKAHRQLRENLEQPRPHIDDVRSQRLLDALRREEQELQIALARHQRDGDDGLLDTWLQYGPDERLWESLSEIRFTPQMRPDEMVARKLEFDQALIEVYRQLAQETSVPRVEEFFRSLLEEAETRAANQSWNMREFQSETEPPSPAG